MSDVDDSLLDTPSRDQQIATLKEIDMTSQELQKQNKLMEALQCMEKSLILRMHIFGLKSPEVAGACQSVAEMCNYLAMMYLQNDDFDLVLELLQKAEVLTEKHKTTRAVTFNNFGCYYRKRGKLRTALAYVKKALVIEATVSEGVRAGDTHLNMCTILSELKRHDQAIGHARTALKLLLIEMFGPDGYASKIPEGADPDEPPKLPADRVAVLAIAYHNRAVQQEHLRQYKPSLSSYEKACKVATTHLDDGHPLVDNLTQSYVTAREKLEELILHEEKLAIKQANKQANRKKGGRGRGGRAPTQRNGVARAGALTSEQLRQLAQFDGRAMLEEVQAEDTVVLPQEEEPEPVAEEDKEPEPEAEKDNPETPK